MQINIPSNAESWLRERAEQSGFATVEEYVLAVVLPLQTNGMGGKRSFLEAATEVGLIGGGSDFAVDLSSNPDHLANSSPSNQRFF
jgi:hypothetical protein